MSREFVYIIVYVALAILVGFLGRRRKWGGMAYFFAALLLTPAIGLLLVAASDRRVKEK